MHDPSVILIYLIEHNGDEVSAVAVPGTKARDCLDCLAVALTDIQEIRKRKSLKDHHQE
jgi:hypothetical protein